MSLKLEGKVAIVTGASKGIGAGIAKDLAAAGAAVAVNYASSREGADKVVNEITKNGGRAIAIQGSVANASDVKRLFEETIKAFGQLDIVVNNAGIFRFDPIEQVTEQEFHAQFGINVLGPLLTTREAVSHFPEKGGSIITISSVITVKPMANSSIYASTKGAVDIMTKALSIELAPRNIRVNAVSPGPTETEGTHTAGIIGGDMEKSFVALTPLGRMGQPADIAKVVTFLASDDADWITGEVINAAGGF